MKTWYCTLIDNLKTNPTAFMGWSEDKAKAEEYFKAIVLQRFKERENIHFVMVSPIMKVTNIIYETVDKRDPIFHHSV